MNRREALKGTAMIFGYALTGSTVATLMQSCESGAKLDWNPQVLSKEQAQILSQIVDRILPATDTPGALDVGVDQFVDRMLYNVFPEVIQKGFAGGIDTFNQEAKNEHGKDFVKLDGEQQDEVIRAFEEKSGPLPGSMWGFSFGEPKEFPFYRMMKELALLGYFHSEKIGKEVLAYNPIPGPYEGCIPYSDVGKIWTE
ncbi:MAG: gluconate 2-dehydrogenase subunit 3 family protein [Mongoliibacter sp.]|uniref:gluconate 2-dehydrogenase subunit 3 family protein n=1 Tax=Mongoliibacter sp. TaxID=2022438 RepID=UPI0012F0B421|nr:gluconate 2-dehydrogenase subunit 3 family protein [Mongoliibacter sp.]TVP53486.1 MAG: gluconate 2-dehydrogenase subunit 3 family protein [Mongoliibacter sp.]